MPHQHFSQCTSEPKQGENLLTQLHIILYEETCLYVSLIGITHHSLFPEVNAHCGGELAVELLVGVPVEEGGLPHP